MTSQTNTLWQKALIGALALGLFIGCSTATLYYEIPPSSHSLTGVSQLHVDQFSGKQASFFKNLLIQEVYRIPNFDYVEDYPKNLFQTAILSGEVEVYSKRDEREQRSSKRVRLTRREAWKRPKHSSRRLRKSTFDFREEEYLEPVVHRTLDLHIRLRVTSPQTAQVLHENVEKVSFQQTYVGDEAILLLPPADAELERLGRLLIRRFLEKLNPSLVQKQITLETGIATWPWSVFHDGHPWIEKGIDHATTHNYDQAIKSWNYVIFAPQVFQQSEDFHFSSDVFAQLKAAKLPPKVLQQLLELHKQSFSTEELEEVLAKLLSRPSYLNYLNIIKVHARTTKNDEIQNLASAHYNLGIVHQLQNQLKLAAHHYAQANAYRPQEKYAQAWTDVQYELGDFNPLDTLIDRTIEAAGRQHPPPEAMVHPSLGTPEALIPTPVPNGTSPAVQPIELPSLSERSSNTSTPSNFPSAPNEASGSSGLNLE